MTREVPTASPIGGTAAPESERPGDIRQRGLAQTALVRIYMPPADLEHPLPEWTAGYFQLSYPHVLLSGDADPFQERSVSIRQPKTSWRQTFLHWLAQTARIWGHRRVTVYDK